MKNSVVQCKISYNIPLLTITRYRNNSKYHAKLNYNFQMELTLYNIIILILINYIIGMYVLLRHVVI